MRFAILFCITAIAIAFIHDVIGPMAKIDIDLLVRQEVARARENKPSLEIVPEPKFHAPSPELKKERL